MDLLAKQIGHFFKTNDFEAVKGETKDGYHIFAQNSPSYRLKGYVSVTIQGKPEEFLIELKLCGKSTTEISFSQLLLTKLCGGYFILRSLKSDEDWMKFEKDFWEHADRVIEYLSNTSNNQ